MGACWQGDQRGPGRHNLYDVPPPRPQLNLADHPRLADLDGWLDGEDAPRTIPPPPVPRDRAARVRLGAPGPGVVNPPSAKIRRQGLGAQFTGDLRTDARRHQLDQLHELLGDYLDEEPELVESASSAIADLGGEGLYGMGHLAKRLGRKPGTLSGWIARGWLPDAAHRRPGGQYGERRYWTGAEVELIVSEAQAAGFLGSGGHDLMITETSFSQRVRSGLERLRGAAHAEE
jgi:hypothetical protein